MNIFRLVALILCIEILLGFFFYSITPKSIKPGGKIDHPSLLKGILERFFLMVSLINNYPHALTLFSALKLATRLKRDSEGPEKESAYNDFFLIGNLISVLIAFSYVYLYQQII